MLYNPQLDTFISVADAGSFNKAAEKLYISAPAVIKQINLLENHLGLKLFERTHRGLVVTEAGKSLYRDAKYLIQYSKETLERAGNIQNEQEEVLRIGVSPITPAKIFIDLWPKIQSNCPDLKLKLVPFDNTPENAREILRNLGSNIDVVIGIFDETMLKVRECNGFRLSTTPFCCAVAMHHPLAKKKKLTLEDLHDQKLLLMRQGWSSQVDLLRNDIVQNHPKIQIKEFDFYNTEIFNQCENSKEILLAVNVWDGIHPLIKMIPVEWQFEIPYGLLYAREPSGKVEKLLDILKRIISDDI